MGDVTDGKPKVAPTKGLTYKIGNPNSAMSLLQQRNNVEMHLSVNTSFKSTSKVDNTPTPLIYAHCRITEDRGGKNSAAQDKLPSHFGELSNASTNSGAAEESTPKNEQISSNPYGD